MAFKLYAIVAKRLKLKVRKSWRLIPTFVGVTREKLVRRGGWGWWGQIGLMIIGFISLLKLFCAGLSIPFVN